MCPEQTPQAHVNWTSSLILESRAPRAVDAPVKWVWKLNRTGAVRFKA